MAFAVVTKYLHDTLCPALLNKAKSLPIEETLKSYINAMDYYVSPTDKNAESSIERMKKAKKDLQSYEKLISLQETFVSLKTHIERMSADYKNINATYTEYASKAFQMESTMKV